MEYSVNPFLCIPFVFGGRIWIFDGFYNSRKDFRHARDMSLGHYVKHGNRLIKLTNVMILLD